MSQLTYTTMKCFQYADILNFLSDALSYTPDQTNHIWSQLTGHDINVQMGDSRDRTIWIEGLMRHIDQAYMKSPVFDAQWCVPVWNALSKLDEECGNEPIVVRYTYIP